MDESLKQRMGCYTCKYDFDRDFKICQYCIEVIEGKKGPKESTVAIPLSEYKYLQACKYTLEKEGNLRGLCPRCGKAIMREGEECLFCNYQENDGRS